MRDVDRGLAAAVKTCAATELEPARQQEGGRARASVACDEERGRRKKPAMRTDVSSRMQGPLSRGTTS